MKIAFEGFLIAALTLPAFGSDHEEAVLRKAIKSTVIAASNQQVLPPLFASRTTGGGALAATEWMIDLKGRVIGFEMADAYVERNAARHRLDQIIASERFHSELIDLEERVPTDEDWKKADAIRPGVKSLIFLSRPAFDRHETYAVVRADLFARDGWASTSFHMIERQADGSWVWKRAIVDGRETMHSDQRHLHEPDDWAWYHTRD